MPKLPKIPKYLKINKYLNNMGKGLGLDAGNIRVCQLVSNYFEVWRQETEKRSNLFVQIREFIRGN